MIPKVNNLSTITTNSSATSLQQQMNSSLFLIRHFFILREEITPFDSDFKIVEKTIDFYQMKNAISRLISVGASNLWSRENNFFGFMTPKLRDNQLDSKLALEKELRQAIERFILSAIQHIIGNLTSFVTKVEAWQSVQLKSGLNLKLTTQSFAEANKLKELLTLLESDMTQTLPPIIQLINLYLNYTQFIMHKKQIIQTLKDNIIEYFRKLEDIIKGHYSLEDCQIINFSMDKLLMFLDQQFQSNLLNKSNE
eukprot:TRINITY_DN2414_c0_g1_i1.p1 TRINITY_DN2414_c0_g1~~TRINITY_DN2414_c0_g1_i1.p1  ORF type:complete len:253 (+),score=86.89 TRINITY_DN2414_c0_g1_i1:2-760(+)